MQRRILIASANPWSFCLAVERDICRRHAGDRVDVLNLYSLVGVHAPEWRRIDHLAEVANRKFQRFVVPAANGADITPDIRLDMASIPPLPHTLGGLRTYRLRGASLGLGILSSVTSLTTIQDPESLSEYGPAFPAAWLTAHLSLQVGEQVAKLGYDEVYVFNGRHAYSRPFCDLVEKVAQLNRYEQGATGDSYIVANTPIHDPKTTARLIGEHDYDPAAGNAFYQDRLAKAAGDPVNFFTAAQIEGHLPTGIEPGTFIAFFTSSSDEMFAITDEAGFGEFPTQFAAAEALLAAAGRHGKKLVIRFHPHLQYKHPSWQREWDFSRLLNQGAVLIAPDDPCDSYALAGVSHAVFTCGSTVGFECTYRGIPNADVGLWVGGVLGAMPAVLDESALERFVAAPILLPDAHEQALRYGSFVRRAGRRLPEFDVGTHPYFARINGRIVDPIRYAVAKLRVGAGVEGRRRSAAIGISDGKVLLDPNLRIPAPESRDADATLRPSNSI